MSHPSQPDPDAARRAALASRLLPWLVIALCFGAALAFLLFRIRFAVGMRDEGFYLAAPMRYALGDLPFRDEFFNPLRMFDIVLAPLFSVAPELGVYPLRLLWGLFQLGVMGALSSLFSRFAPAGLVVLASAAAIWIPNVVWSPGYHVMGGTFFVLAWSTWMGACLTPRAGRGLALAVTSGIAFFLGAMSYLPLLVVEIIPAAVLLREWIAGRRGGPRATATLVHLVTLAVLAAAALLVFASFGLLGDWWDAFVTINSLGFYKLSISEKAVAVSGQLAPYSIHLAAGIAAALVLGRVPCSARLAGKPAVAVALAAGLVFALHALFFTLEFPPVNKFVRDPMVRPLRVTALLLGVQLGVSLLARMRREPPVSDAWRLVSRSVLAGSVILSFLFAFFSTMAFKAMFAAPALVVCVVVAFYRSLRRGRVLEGTPRLLAPLLAGALCLSVATVAYHARSIHPSVESTTPYTHPRLAGIRGRPHHVSELEQVTRYLSDRVRVGDYLLAFDNLPLVYFLTRTRPAIDHAWPSRLTRDVKRRSLRRMVAAGRVPEYAVQSRTPQSLLHPNALRTFVEARYEQERVIGSFVIWRLR